MVSLALVLIGYELVTVLFPFMVIFFLLHRSGTTKGSKMKDFGKGMLFAVYLLAFFILQEQERYSI